MQIVLYVATIFIVLTLNVVHAADYADSALVSVFQRDKGNLVCLPGNMSLKEIRERFNPYIEGIDPSLESSYRELAKAVYTAFPCPFASSHSGLRAATKDEIIGVWLFPDASIKLRHGPKSPEWQRLPGIPPIKCEGVLIHDSGEYRVMQLRGNVDCPTKDSLQKMRTLPKVSSWSIVSNNRISIVRTDVPEQFEEWDFFVVQTPFEFYSVKFETGDLVTYLRNQPGNSVNAATAFRHLKPLR